ncbi:MAG: ABC transporter substrate-binding protein [Clostridia bacterium]|nr:ABC transporter substrate-binding protein [Clostridia bacterium]
MKKRIIASILALAALFTTSALTSCGSEEIIDEDGFIIIRSCFTTGMTGAVNNFAIQKGLYEAEGIRFDNVQSSGNATSLSMLSRGEIDVADGDPSTYIPGIYNGVPAKLVGNMWRYSGCYWLIANNDIKTIADLKGKNIGTAGTTGGMRLSVLKMLESAGLDEDDVTLIANGSYQAAYATITSGEVDATIIHNPYASLAEAEGIGHVLGRAWDYIPDYYTGTIVASDDFIKNHPDELQKFITAYYKVHELVKNEYFDEFITWASKEMNTTEEVMRDAVESEIDVWLDYPVVPIDRVETTLDILLDYGWLEDEIDDLDNIINNTFAENAAKELGMTDPYAK